MKHFFDTEYENLRRHIITMGTEVEQQVYRSVEAMLNFDERLAEQVIAKDNDIDKMEGKTITRFLLQQLFHSIEVKDEDRYLPFLLEESYLPVLKLSILFIISLLDRFNTSEIIVCNSGIAVGYANWLAKTKNKALK